MGLVVSPKGKCTSPCVVTIEALSVKNSKITKYQFFINEKMIESNVPKITTTLIFTDSQIDAIKKKEIDTTAPFLKIFHIRAEGLVSDISSIRSVRRKIVVQASPYVNTTVDLITKSVNPFGKVKILVTGSNPSIGP